VPTYSYRCTGCSVEFDIQQAFTDPALTTCEACGGSLRKLFSAVGVTFNGSGFYRTDSRASTGDKKTGDKKTANASAGTSKDSSGSSGSSSTASSSSSSTASPAPSPSPSTSTPST
jgi:putative FmdB family regulatory protein